MVLTNCDTTIATALPRWRELERAGWRSWRRRPSGARCRSGQTWTRPWPVGLEAACSVRCDSSWLPTAISELAGADALDAERTLPTRPRSSPCVDSRASSRKYQSAARSAGMLWFRSSRARGLVAPMARPSQPPEAPPPDVSSTAAPPATQASTQAGDGPGFCGACCAGAGHT